MRNLPDSITWQNLKDKFKTVGDIKYAEIKERGCGVIRLVFIYYSITILIRGLFTASDHIVSGWCKFILRDR